MIDQNLLASLRPEPKKEAGPKKHFITFTHEEWVKLTEAFGGLDSPVAYKELLNRIANGTYKLVAAE